MLKKKFHTIDNYWIDIFSHNIGIWFPQKSEHLPPELFIIAQTYKYPTYYNQLINIQNHGMNICVVGMPAGVSTKNRPPSFHEKSTRISTKIGWLEFPQKWNRNCLLMRVIFPLFQPHIGASRLISKSVNENDLLGHNVRNFLTHIFLPTAFSWLTKSWT